jgi:cytochrome b561
MIKNTKSSWGSVSRWLHWGLGLAIIAMIAGLARPASVAGTPGRVTALPL